MQPSSTDTQDADEKLHGAVDFLARPGALNQTVLYRYSWSGFGCATMNALSIRPATNDQRV
jgi:hypothetical protein